ncbi:MAG: hypothetical protein H0U32_01875 [Thermoleophilaceae bacterium]|nr:hypothetical protein [Thermoleophilaceae bacterium]
MILDMRSPFQGIELRLDEIAEEFRLNREEFEKNRAFQDQAYMNHQRFIEESRADWKEFTRTILLRVERLGRDEWRELSRMNDELERQGAERRVEQNAERSELRDLREESRAQTQALLRMIDRMDGLEPPGAAA